MTVEQYVGIQSAFANVSTLGDNTIVAAQTGKKIRVLSYALSNQAGTANNVKFRSAANDKTSLKVLQANATISYPGTVDGWAFETNRGESLVLNLSAATAVGCDVVFQLV